MAWDYAAAGGQFGGDAPASPFTLYQSDLEPWMDEAWVTQLWAGYGHQVGVKMVRDRTTGWVAPGTGRWRRADSPENERANPGYCFVEFTSQQACQMALGLNGQPIPGTPRAFRLNWASGAGAQPAVAPRPWAGGAIGMDRGGPEFSVFVGDLAPEVTDYMLASLFTHYPSFKTAKVVTDPVTNVSRGYGFVRFTDESEQVRAIAEMQGQYCGSRPMRISLATPKNRVASPQGPTGYGGASPLNQFTDPTNTTVFVGGLSAFVTEDELRSFFAPYGIITYVKIPPGKGCGFVQYADRPSAEMAIQMLNGYNLGGSRIRLSWGRSHTASRAGYSPPMLPPIPAYPPMGVGMGVGMPYGIPAYPVYQVPMMMPVALPPQPADPNADADPRALNEQDAADKEALAERTDGEMQGWRKAQGAQAAQE
ncbi:hypothetical protein DFJ74DRAFT_529873 [Hyaloraphidium curvatum]|nr:hypothetical protein DFJ74DRAFT_529873 [Hyaloraphidium curvatum]